MQSINITMVSFVHGPSVFYHWFLKVRYLTLTYLNGSRILLDAE